MDAIENPELHKAIRRAIKSGDVDCLGRLLNRHPEAVTMMTPFGTWLHVAASFGCLEIVEKLVVEYGLNVNQNGGPNDGSALDYAATKGHFDIAKYLLERGAEMDVSEPERNPLFAAILGGNVEIGKLLIESGIDTKVRYTGKSMKDMDALAFAREQGAEEFVGLLGE